MLLEALVYLEERTRMLHAMAEWQQHCCCWTMKGQRRMQCKHRECTNPIAKVSTALGVCTIMPQHSPNRQQTLMERKQQGLDEAHWTAPLLDRGGQGCSQCLAPCLQALSELLTPTGHPWQGHSDQSPTPPGGHNSQLTVLKVMHHLHDHHQHAPKAYVFPLTLEHRLEDLLLPAWICC